MKQNKVVYTVLTGYKEHLQNPFFNHSDGYEKICFTDNPNLKSDVWSIERLDDCGLDYERESRRPKLLPHRFLSNFELSLYVDNTVRFKVDPKEIFQQCADAPSPFVCFHHPAVARRRYWPTCMEVLRR